jgi:group I intron endonuclease
MYKGVITMGEEYEKSEDNSVCEHSWCICTDCPKFREAGNDTSCKVKIRDTILHRAELERSRRPEIDKSERYGYIYLTENLVSGRLYIGQHKSKKFDNSYNGSGVALIDSISRYGSENFKSVVICWCNSLEDMNNKETEWIQRYVAHESNVFYNIHTGGNGAPISDEQKKKISETEKKFYETHPGTHLGKNHTEEAKRKMSERHYDCSGENHPMYGRHHTEEAKRKMSVSKSKLYSNGNSPFRGRHHTEDTKRVIQKKSLEYYSKNTHPFKGKHHSEETKRKLAEMSHIKSRKKVICLDDGSIYDSVMDAAKYVGYSSGYMTNCIKARKRIGGKLFMLLKEYEESNDRIKSK